MVEAAEQAGGHRDPGAADPGEEGQDLGRPDPGRLDRPEGLELAAGHRPVLRRSNRRNAGRAGGHQDPGLGPAPQALDGQEDHAVDGEEDPGRQRLGEQRPQRVLEDQPGEPDGDRRRHEEPAEAGFGGVDSPGPE